MSRGRAVLAAILPPGLRREGLSPVVHRRVLRTLRFTAIPSSRGAVLLLLAVAAGLPRHPVQAQQPKTTAFVDVTVVPMDREVVLPHSTVVVTDRVITQLGPRGSVVPPDGARIIEGGGRYLMPGLADLHVHLRTRADLVGYLRYGVTTVLDLGGPSRLLAWRDSIAAATMVGPRLLVSRFVDGPGGRAAVVSSVEEAREVVRDAADSGYDYIKVYNSLTTEQFDAVIDESSRLGIPVIGHGVRQPGLRYSLEAGQAAVVHAEEFYYAFFGHRMDRGRIPDAVELAHSTGSYLIPNLSAYEVIARQWGRQSALDSLLGLPEVAWLHTMHRAGWAEGRYVRRRGTIDAQLAFLRELTLAMSRGGVTLLAGSDSPVIPGMFPGKSLHDDLDNLVRSGLSPFQALATATANAGRFIAETTRETVPTGVVAVGARGDLVMLESNPLSDLAAARRPLGILTAGRWWIASELESELRAHLLE